MEIIRDGGNGLMDIKEASEYLKLKISAIYQLCMRHKIPVVKIGRLNRFRKADLDAFIENCLVEKE